MSSKLTEVCDMNKAVFMVGWLAAITIAIQGTNEGLRKLTQYRSKPEWCQLKLSDSGLFKALYHKAPFLSSFMK